MTIRNASARAKVAIATRTKLIPSARSSRPNVKRCTPADWSVPTVPSMRPNTAAASERNTWPRSAKAAIDDSANSRISVYSGDWNSVANKARVGANRSRATAPTVPPAKDA